MIKLNKINIEGIFLLAIFSVMLWAGYAVLFDHKLKHDFPYAYLASDTFQHQVRAESIKLMGNYKYEAPYIVAGYTDNVGFYQPQIYHLGVLFSYASGLETYDSTYLIVFVLACFAALIMYFIVRQLNKNIAILSIPLAVIIFSQAPYIGFTWGHWPSVTAQFFLVAFFWAISKIDLEKSFILFAVFLSAIIMTHTSEAVFAAIFLIIYFIYKLMKKDYKTLLKQSVIGALISFIVCFYYLAIFKFTWAKMQPYSFSVELSWGSPMFGLLSFKVLLIFLLIGLIISFFYILKNKEAGIGIFIGVVMLLIGYGNYYGFGQRAFQARFFWPIYFSVFFGIGIYSLFKLVKKAGTIASFGTAVAFLLILNIPSFSVITPTTARFTTPGIMTAQHWEMFKWFQNSVVEGKVLFFYGDAYNQNAILRNTHLPPYMVNQNDYTSALQNRTIKRKYEINLLGDHHGVYYAYKKSFFSYGYHAQEEESKDPTYFYKKARDICDFDYYVFDRVSQPQTQGIIQYNMVIANQLLKNGWIKAVFANDYVAVLKNNKPREDCINETRIS